MGEYETNKQREEEFRALRKLPIYSWYMKGARRLLLEFIDCFNDKLKIYTNHDIKKADPYNKAIIDMLLESGANLENFILHNYDEIRFKNWEHDKKGRVIKCKAYLSRYVKTIKEVTEVDV